ncbi:MAG: hypothetical protein Q9170_002918 [Blastenia crenularia]
MELKNATEPIEAMKVDPRCTGALTAYLNKNKAQRNGEGSTSNSLFTVDAYDLGKWCVEEYRFCPESPTQEAAKALFNALQSLKSTKGILSRVKPPVIRIPSYDEVVLFHFWGHGEYQQLVFGEVIEALSLLDKVMSALHAEASIFKTPELGSICIGFEACISWFLERVVEATSNGQPKKTIRTLDELHWDFKQTIQNFGYYWDEAQREPIRDAERKRLGELFFTSKSPQELEQWGNETVSDRKVDQYNSDSLADTWPMDLNISSHYYVAEPTVRQPSLVHKIKEKLKGRSL